uniref:SVP7 n=1 Tax=Osmanthus fragrans TaxID=93977 RepID=A0A482F0H2_9LAMI|nr:SVP7 [Osmanthus fragrans]
MVRQKIQIKKIDDLTARQVTFSKRRRGVFKKAQELSTLCDAEIALIVFSATGKLFQYSSSSMMQLIERHREGQAENSNKLGQPSFQLLENNSYGILSKMLVDKTRELRQLKGEDLQGLGLNELIRLEKMVLGGLNHVAEAENDKFLKEISLLRKKESELMEENAKLKQQAEPLEMVLSKAIHPSASPIFLMALILLSGWAYLSTAEDETRRLQPRRIVVCFS